MKRLGARARVAIAAMAALAILLPACGDDENGGGGSGGGGGGEESSPIACGRPPEKPALALTYRATSEEGSVQRADLDAAAESLCEYFPDVIDGGGAVAIQGSDRIRVTVADAEQAAELRRYAEVPTAYFYDWEPNLVSGAKPGAYDAIFEASRQPPRPGCSDCSHPGPQHYLFNSETEELAAGPADATQNLAGVGGASVGPTGGVILTVPPGTVVVSEGSIWFALRDHVALDGGDVVDPEQAIDPQGAPTVVFELTAEGQADFEQLTKGIAQRGGGHFAFVLDNEVLTRPLIDAAANPAGIDASNGVQISGLGSVSEARRVAGVLQINSLGVDLELEEVQARR